MPSFQSLPDRIPSTNPGAEPPRDARDSGSARSHSTHLKLAPQIDRKWSPTWSLLKSKSGKVRQTDCRAEI